MGLLRSPACWKSVRKRGGSKGMGPPRVIHIRYQAGIHQTCHDEATSIPSKFNQISTRCASDVNQTFRPFFFKTMSCPQALLGNWFS
eukprot:11886912-Karenia_brevis.AAC.1